jgi:hypothetical protein
LFIQNILRELKATSVDSFPRTAFLIMFVGVVVGPLVLLGHGGSSAHILPPISLFWYFPAISLLLLSGIGFGFLMFRYELFMARVSSIRVKYQ